MTERSSHKQLYSILVAKRGEMKTDLRVRLSAEQRPALLGRLRMADWIEMSEKDFASEVEQIEKDPLFKKLYFGNPEAPSVIRRQRWPNGRMASAYYEMNEGLLAGGERVPVEEMLGGQSEVVGLIQKMGRQAFERYFLHGDEPLTLEEIGKRTGLNQEQVQKIHDFIVELGARSEFALPQRDPGLKRSYTCIARLSLDHGDPSFEFFSAHWARGLYQVRYDLLERWKDQGKLAGQERRKLSSLLKRIETINLRQSTLFRILESVTKLQAEYLTKKEERLKRPISLRQLARRLDLAPSTVSRALHGRSVQLPWSKEMPLITLVPGRRRILREIMSRWLEEGGHATDAALAERLRQEYGIRVSRRTVNAVRNELIKPAL